MIAGSETKTNGLWIDLSLLGIGGHTMLDHLHYVERLRESIRASRTRVNIMN